MNTQDSGCSGLLANQGSSPARPLPSLPPNTDPRGQVLHRALPSFSHPGQRLRGRQGPVRRGRPQKRFQAGPDFLPTAGGQSPGFCSQRACARLPFNRMVRFSAERIPPSLRRCGLRDASFHEGNSSDFPTPTASRSAGPGTQGVLAGRAPQPWVSLYLCTPGCTCGDRETTRPCTSRARAIQTAPALCTLSLSSSGISPRWVPGFRGAAEQREQWPQILLHGLHDLREPLHSVFFPSQGRAL